MKIPFLLILSTGLVSGLGDFVLVDDLIRLAGQYIKIGFVPSSPNHLERVKNLIDAATPSLVKGLLRVRFESAPKVLDPPIYFEYGTPEEAKLNLNNSLASFCFDDRFKGDICLPEGKYSGIEVVKDELAGGLVVVMVNNLFKQIVLSYRPTANLQNFLDDLDYGIISMPGSPRGVKIYRGFYKAYLGLYRGVQDALVKKLQDPKYKDYVVHITGYSMGSANALFSIPDTYKTVKSIDPNRRIQVFTYEGPRVGNLDFVRYIASFNIPITRSDYGRDLVALIPARSLGFVHVGQEIYTPYKTQKTIVCSQKYEEDPNCILSATHTIPELNNHLRPFGEFVNFPPY